MRLREFVLGGGDDGDDLFKYAKMWWNGDDTTRLMIEKTLDRQGWEIGQDEGYDNGGVFVVQAGDEDGDSYISWSIEELG